MPTTNDVRRSIPNDKSERRRLPMTQLRWRVGTRLACLALATMIAMTAVAGCGGEKKHHVSAGLSTQLQQIVDSAVKSPKTVFPGTALYVSQPKLGTWTGAAGE